MKAINRYFTGISMFLLLVIGSANAATYPSDTVILKFNNNVNLIVITDDAQALRSATGSYDLNKIINDLRYKSSFEDDETITLVIEDEFGDRYLKDTTIVVESRNRIRREGNDEDYEARRKERERRYRRRTRNYYNIDLGMNNYLEDGNFPDESNALYTVRPWGSWYLNISTLFKTNVAGPLYLEWGGGIDWYTFKFENSRTRITKTDPGLVFSEDLRPDISALKSKLSAAYLNVRFIPVFDFSRSGNRDRDRLWNENIGNGFRIGFGPYGAYRIDSWTKNTYKLEGDKKKDKESSNYYLNNIRYGARVQIGWKGVDFFAMYDISELFSDSRNTPKLNAFTFGFTL